MKELIHLYGPIAIHGYGVAICIGLCIALWCATQHVWCRRYIGTARFIDLILSAIGAGIIGGRILYSITEWHEFSTWLEIGALWDGGFSLLGTIIAVLCFIPWYSWRHNIPYFPTIDLCALYAPLFQSIARLGCLWAGCCSGIISTVPWAIYDETGTFFVHPTQLYSTLALLFVFLFLRFVITRYFKQPGHILAWYLFSAGIERATLDFWRADHYTHSATTHWISGHQILALSISFVGLIILVYASFFLQREHTYGPI